MSSPEKANEKAILSKLVLSVDVQEKLANWKSLPAYYLRYEGSNPEPQAQAQARVKVGPKFWLRIRGAMKR